MNEKNQIEPNYYIIDTERARERLKTVLFFSFFPFKIKYVTAQSAVSLIVLLKNYEHKSISNPRHNASLCISMDKHMKMSNRRLQQQQQQTQQQHCHRTGPNRTEPTIVSIGQNRTWSADDFVMQNGMNVNRYSRAHATAQFVSKNKTHEIKPSSKRPLKRVRSHSRTHTPRAVTFIHSVGHI